MRTVLAVALAAAAATAQQRQSLAGEWRIQAQAEGAPELAIQVPSAFETALGTAFDGVATYRRALPLPERFAGRVRIEFAAVATHATVRCNGVEVGRHLGGWTPFRVDVTDQLRWDGHDALEVLVDEKVGHNTQGFLPIVQPHFGGIWQDVTLCLDRAPVLDRLTLFAFGRGNGELAYDFAALPVRNDDPAVAAVIEVLDGERVFATQRRDVGRGERIAGVVPVPQVRPWLPAQPQLYTLRLRLLAPDRELDRVERRVGFRSLAADGTRVRWNGEPLQVRGVLHWGCSPPHLAPSSDREHWRAQLAAMRERGFNLIKCCLWVPPPCLYELADELGILVWQEYPTWHPKIDAAHKQELLAEYAEFFAADRNHPAVAFRSITCETGHGADFDVVKALYLACKEAVPETLVVDDSSWIGWQRISDFWDEHPYGNNSWFPGRLVEFQRHIAEHGKKPLLLGECIAADTWIDSAAWRAAHGTEERWWRPDCWVAQQATETWILRELGEATLRAMRPQSLDFAMRNRKFQIEQLRLSMPDAGYVVSVARDFAKARMGLVDDVDRDKWPASAWAWHGDTMLCLDAAWDARALGAGSPPPAVRIAHSGRGALRGQLRVWTDDVDARPQQVPVAVAPGEVSVPVAVAMPAPGAAPRRVRVYARLTGSHAASNEWDLWLVPPPPAANSDVSSVEALTPDLLDQLERGARVILHAGDRPGSLRTEAMWSLRGAPFAPSHPVHARVPAELLLELCSFDLERGRVLPWDALRDQIDPVLAFWETHDIPQVRLHLFAGACRVGRGRLLATTLRLDGAANPAGAFVQHEFAEYLQRGPAPARELSAATIAALRAQLTEKRIELPLWRFRTDPDDQGRAANWQDKKTDASAAPWRDLRAGSHWENQAEDLKHVDGIAWYRVDVAVPADWQGLDARVVFEGVDDSFEAWLDGEPIGRFGDPATKTTVWLERQVAELGVRLRAGATNTFVLRVVDHGGAGGLWKPVFVTTGPASRTDPLLH